MVGSRSGLMSEVELLTAPLGWPSGTSPRDRPKAEARVRGGSGPLPAAPLAGSKICLPTTRCSIWCTRSTHWTRAAPHRWGRRAAPSRRSSSSCRPVISSNRFARLLYSK
ncbi:unnamed protein product [Musa hybrid cultivar]